MTDLVDMIADLIKGWSGSEEVVSNTHIICENLDEIEEDKLEEEIQEKIVPLIRKSNRLTKGGDFELHFPFLQLLASQEVSELVLTTRVLLQLESHCTHSWELHVLVETNDSFCEQHLVFCGEMNSICSLGISITTVLVDLPAFLKTRLQ